MDRKHLSEIVATFQIGQGVAGLTSTHDYFVTTPPPIPGYVAQRVCLDGPRSGARIALLAAPGAVGKSVAAQWIANNRQWVYVDSSRMQVGDHGLTGLLRKALPNTSRVFGMVERGEVGFVIDALDEALIRSNVDNLFAFIEDVVSLAVEQRGSATNTVLVARDDVADLIQLKLDDLGVAFVVARLDFFDRPAALRMLGHLARGGELDQPTRQLAESRLIQIGSALLGEAVRDLDAAWTRLESFLGYAPVLAILASGLDVENPYREFTSGEPVPASTLLLELVETLLVREQDKFVSAKGNELKARCSPAEDYVPELVFSPVEQSRRLYQRMLNRSIDRADSPVSESLWPHYRDPADQWLNDHPFQIDDGVAAQVFSDFVLARAVGDHLGTLRKDLARLNPGRFFAPFVHEFCDGVVPEWLVPWLLTSSGSSAGSSRDWAYTQSGEVAHLVIPNALGDGDLVFHVGDLTGYLELVTPGLLGGGVIVTDQSVELGSDGELVLFGGLLVVAREIVLGSTSVQVAPSGAFLMAGEVASAARVADLRQVGDASLVVRGFAEWPLFHPYQMSVSEQDVQVVMDAPIGLADLRALLRSFRKVVHDPRATLSADRMNLLVAHSERRRAYLEALLESGFLQREGSAYFLSNDALSSRAISFESLTRGQMDQPVFTLLVELERARRSQSS